MFKEDFGIEGVLVGHSEEIRTIPRQSAMSLQVPTADSRSHSQAPCRCPQCGGSGLLRIDDQRYRTCLDCLGQGHSPATGGDGLFFRIVNAASASAAR